MKSRPGVPVRIIAVPGRHGFQPNVKCNLMDISPHIVKDETLKQDPKKELVIHRMRLEIKRAFKTAIIKPEPG